MTDPTLIATTNRRKPAEVMATWSLSLDTTCPECEHDFDLTNQLGEDGWVIEICEHGTPRTDNYETSCPECGHEFSVCFEY